MVEVDASIIYLFYIEILSYIQIFDGPDGRFPSLGRFCGTSYFRKIFEITGNNVAVVFRTPGYVFSAGFGISYRCKSSARAEIMMTSSNGNISALLTLCEGNSSVTGEFPSQRPVTRSFDVFFDLRLNKRLSKQSWGWWYETPSCPLWRHCDEIRLIPLINGQYNTSLSTHWSLGYVIVIQKVHFPNWFQELIPWALPVKLVLGDCHHAVDDKLTLVQVMVWCCQLYKRIRRLVLLTHWGRDKMDAISTPQTVMRVEFHPASNMATSSARGICSC